MNEKTKNILKIYAQMPLEEIFKLEANLPEKEKIMTKKIPIPALVVNEKLLENLKK